MNWFMVAEVWPHKYLISPIEIGVNLPGSNLPVYLDY